MENHFANNPVFAHYSVQE